jgi:5-methylcytosine-specific restriction endonuclease McrBC regulatory subunit McrC
MANWYIYDNQTTDTLGFNISWLPTQVYNYVKPRIKQRRSTLPDIALDAGPYVGAIPLINGDTLYIIPRVGKESYSRMLFVIEGIEDSVNKEFEQYVKLGYGGNSDTIWTSLLARPFIERLRLIEKESLSTTRINTQKQLRYITGKVKVVNSLLSLKRNDEFPVHTSIRETTPLNLENRLLSTASAALLKVKAIDKPHRNIAIRWARLAERNYITSRELAQISVGIKNHRYTGSRSYYVSGLVMAKLILSQTGLSLESHDNVDSESVITNFSDLFEKYIRVVVAKALTPCGFVVEKREHNLPTLFTDRTCELKPDILISKNGQTKLIIDVKYKPKNFIASSDYYQMNTYLENFDISKGMLVLPNHSQSEFSLTQRQTLHGRQIFELRLPLSDWDTCEKTLVSSVERLLTT